MILSDLIKSYTVQNKTTYRKLAKEIGVPFILLYRFSKGRQVRTDAFKKIMAWVLK